MKKYMDFVNHCDVCAKYCRLYPVKVMGEDLTIKTIYVCKNCYDKDYNQNYQ